MKTIIVGVKRVAGTAKASGNPFEMTRVLALSHIVNSNGKTQVNGAGYEVMEIDLERDALPDFMHLQYPVNVELTLEPRPRFGKVEMICTGVKQVASMKAAA